MKPYPENSPHAIARILAMFMISDGHIDERELQRIEQLNLFELIRLSRAEFLEVLRDYCDAISDDANADGTIRLIDRERLDHFLDEITHPEKRLLTCTAALDLCKADTVIDEGEMAMLRHMMTRWNISLDLIQHAFAPKNAPENL